MKILACLFAASVFGLVIGLGLLVSGCGVGVALLSYTISGLMSFAALLVRLERPILPKVLGECARQQA